MDSHMTCYFGKCFMPLLTTSIIRGYFVLLDYSALVMASLLM